MSLLLLYRPPTVAWLPAPERINEEYAIENIKVERELKKKLEKEIRLIISFIQDDDDDD